MRVVLDANVFVSALIRPEGPPGRVVFLLSADPRPFDLILSQALADEIHAALGYPRVRKCLRSADIDPNDWFSNYELIADFVEPATVVGVAPDPDDDKVLGTALGGRADFIVTGDHGLLTVGVYETIRIVSPAVFLREVLRITSP
jgi:putative PIN family toxin of toxin-antitoxin system